MSSDAARRERAAGYSARRKLGLAGYLRLAVLNPEIGASAPGVVRRIHQEAELGLHGGRNHDLWQHGVASWSRREVADELDWSVGWLDREGLAVEGFCSPGYRAPAPLPELLVERGFLYRTDRFGHEASGALEEPSGLLNIGNNIVGEPGGVAYLEHQSARGLSPSEVRADFADRLQAAGDYAVTYDHPYYAGVRALDRVEDLVRVAQDAGFEVVTTREIAHRQLKGPASGGILE